ncbi:MAG: EscU/YscU/HrcU family type III secretion system export apparatus switch protein [Oscillospiraceae bacterium]
MSAYNNNPSSKQQKAVALKYNTQSDAAPIIVASGYGHIAEQIINIADSNGVPVFRDTNAVSVLSMMDVGSYVPPELYELVATIYLNLLQVSDEIKTENFKKFSNLK